MASRAESADIQRPKVDDRPSPWRGVWPPGEGTVLPVAADTLPGDASVSLEDDFGDDTAVTPRPSELRLSEPGNAVDPREARYRQEGRWEDLIELYLARLEASKVPAERARTLRRIADVFSDHLGDSSQAMDALVEAYPLDPGAVGERAGELAQALGRWQELTTAAHAIAAGSVDNERKVEACEQLARWYGGPLARPDLAELAVARIHELDPEHALVRRRAASVYREQGAFGAQKAALMAALDRAQRDEDKLSALLALGALEESPFLDLEAATRAYEGALVIDPRSLPALEGIERIARAEERFSDVVRALRQQIEVAPDDDARKAALRRLADLYQGHFLKHDRAAPLLERILEIDPGDGLALDALERAYHAMHAHRELAAVLDRRADLLAGNARLDALLSLAELLETKLGDGDGAFEAYRRACATDDTDARPLLALARLSEASGDWLTAATYRTRLADVTPDNRVKAQIHVTIGDLLSPRERNPGRARMHYERAAVFDPAQTLAWESLEKLALRDGDDKSAAFCLEQRAVHTEGPRKKAALYAAVGVLRAAGGDEAGAREAFSLALAADPSNEAAAEPMLSAHVKDEDWNAAAPLADLLARGAEQAGDTDRAFELHRLSVRISGRTGDKEKAFAASLAAFRLDCDDQGAREDLLLACHAVRDRGDLLVRASRCVARIASEPKDLSAASLVLLGDLARAMGDDGAAALHYRAALGKEKDLRSALEGLGAVFVAEEDWKNACACKERLAKRAQGKDERFTLHVEVAEVWMQRAGDLDLAAASFERALDVRPHDHWLLHTMLSVYTQLERWADVARILRGIVLIEETDERKAKGVYAIAQVTRDKLEDPEAAARLYDEALDLDPSRLDAFERIARIHTESKDWEALRGAYTRMIDRARGRRDRELLYALHHQLGLVCRDRIVDADLAISAFTEARALRPERDEDRRILAELYVLVDRVDSAVTETRAALAHSPLEPAPYHELYALFLRQGAYDRAWCTADVLEHLEACTAEQAQFLRNYPPVHPKKVPGTLSASAWASHLHHPELDDALTRVFSVMVPAVLAARFGAMPAKEMHALVGEAVTAPRTRAEHEVFGAARDGAEILALSPVAVTRRPGPELVTVGVLREPSLVVSPESAVPAPRELAFIVARRLASLRAPFLSRTLFPSLGELRGLLEAAVRIAGGRASSAFEAAVGRAMSPHAHASLGASVNDLARRGAKADLLRWYQLADVTASRAGLLVTGSLGAARKGLVLEKHHARDLSPKEHMIELVAFATSDTYAELRRAIGVTVESRMRT